MAHMTIPELQVELQQRVRSAGQGGKTTAEDLRDFLSHLLETVDALPTQSSGGVNSSAPVEKTYAQLTDLITSNALIIGGSYILTDFQTVHSISYTGDLNVGPVEPLLLFASSPNTISEKGYSTIYPDDVVHYVAVNDQTMMPGSTKGYIRRRFDTKNNNDVCYDFRTVLFRRWADASGYYTYTYDPGNGAAHRDATTFESTNYGYGNIRNNTFIGLPTQSAFDFFDVVVAADCYFSDNYFGNGCRLSGFTAQSNSGMQFVNLQDNSGMYDISTVNNAAVYSVKMSNHSQMASVYIQNAYVQFVTMDNADMIAVQSNGQGITHLLLSNGSAVFYLTGGMTEMKLIGSRLISFPGGGSNCVFIRCDDNVNLAAGTINKTYIENTDYQLSSNTPQSNQVVFIYAYANLPAPGDQEKLYYILTGPDANTIYRFNGAGYDQLGGSMGGTGGTDATAVHKTGDENIDGQKTFSQRVGIGTTAPASKLQVIDGPAEMRVSSGSGGETPYVAVINNNPGGKAAALIAGTTGSAFTFEESGGFYITSEAKSNFQNNSLGNGNTVQMTILPSGNVGIGTTTPTSRLTVVGTLEITSGGIKFSDGSMQNAASVNQAYVDNADSIILQQIEGLQVTAQNQGNAIGTLQTDLGNFISSNGNGVYARGDGAGTLVKTGWSNSAPSYQSAVLAGESSTATGQYSTVFSGYMQQTLGHWSSIIGGRNNVYGPLNDQSFGAIIGSAYCVANAPFCLVANSTNCTIDAGCAYTTLIGCNGLHVTSGINQTFVNNRLVANASGPVLTAPNGTRWQQVVDDSGNVTTIAI